MTAGGVFALATYNYVQTAPGHTVSIPTRPVVVAANDTPRKLLEESLNLLDPSKVLGIVFNRDHRPLYGYYSGDYSGRFRRGSAGSPIA